jgi:hypothetical protein
VVGNQADKQAEKGIRLSHVGGGGQRRNGRAVSVLEREARLRAALEDVREQAAHERKRARGWAGSLFPNRKGHSHYIASMLTAW